MAKRDRGAGAWPESATDWDRRLAMIRWAYIPTPKRFRLYVGKHVAKDHGRDELSVLVDAKAESKSAVTRDLLALTQEVHESTWDFCRRAQGEWTVDEIAADLDLPTFERIEEINLDNIWRAAREASDDEDSDEYRKAEEDEQHELWKQWARGVESAANHVIYNVDLALVDVDEPNAFKLVEISSGPPADVRKHPWRGAGRAVAQYLDYDGNLVDLGERAFLLHHEATTWREFVWNSIDSVLVTGATPETRRIYERVF